MPNMGKLMSGFRVFKATTFPQKKDVIEHLLVQGQRPSTLIVACSDLRISPENIFATNPGELYVLSNLGGLVPKYSMEGIHGIMSAIEYAVTEIEVENIIVLGHAKCDAIKIMMSEKFSGGGISKSMKTWLSVAKEARDAVKTQLADKTPEEQIASCEHESVVVSLYNLMEYPYISKRLDENKLKIFGCYFDIETASIMTFNPDNGFFEPIS